MIDISCQIYIQKITWQTHINLVDPQIRQKKLRQTCRESPTVVLSHHVKIGENY